ncbi:alpha/beta hydrolase [Dactylosporangium sp. AC04546]|uniref:alpha/beta fold hydrolase n=1 Tax=Dactylosporangium sp. AC04546 TaxID=2862460 RepID=UPI001EE07E32|nr:alpha/beta hydrolase [Dactylosporangium sp. AC04546]WVK82904.1 alpha/beta hydrolase [Dactylosporangium sp. AC04546]
MPQITGTDAKLYYELRGTGPLVALVGAPMDATFFAPLADLLAPDHTVLITDPRGVNRSVLDDPEQDSAVEQRAADLARLIEHAGAGPAIVVGSSGGAVTALQLAQARPDLLAAVVAHEPPIIDVLDDRDERHAGVEDMIATYAAGDPQGAWMRFFTNANIPLPPFDGPPPEPDPVQAATERFWFLHEMRATTRWRPDVETLRASPVRIVVAVGEDSAGQLCDRSVRALAAALGSAPAVFPGGHIAFVEDPARFAARLREVIG